MTKKRRGRPRKESILELITEQNEATYWTEKDILFSDLGFLLTRSPRPGEPAREDAHETAFRTLDMAESWIHENVPGRVLERSGTRHFITHLMQYVEHWDATLAALHSLKLLRAYVKHGDATLAWCIALAFEAGVRTATLNVWDKSRAYRVGERVLQATVKGGKQRHICRFGEAKAARYAKYRAVIEEVRDNNPELSMNSVFRIVQKRLGDASPSVSTLWRAWHTSKKPPR